MPTYDSTAKLICLQKNAQRWLILELGLSTVYFQIVTTIIATTDGDDHEKRTPVDPRNMKFCGRQVVKEARLNNSFNISSTTEDVPQKLL